MAIFSTLIVRYLRLSVKKEIFTYKLVVYK